MTAPARYPPCEICGRRSVMRVNALGACDEHVDEVYRLAIGLVAHERGADVAEVQRITAMLLEAMFPTEDEGST